MRRYYIKTAGIIAVLTSAVLSGCNVLGRIPWAESMPIERTPAVVQEEPEHEPVVAIVPPEPAREEITLFVESANYRLSLHEPPAGLYLGAYILSNPAIDFCITRFEAATGKPHAIYSYYTSAGETVPAAWLLECMARHKIPNIIVSSELNASDDMLEQTARAIGEFRMPMFIHPVPVERRFDPDQYRLFFRRAAEIFREHAPEAAIVWTVKAEDAFDSMRFYPGDGYADWAGISLRRSITEDRDYDSAMMGAFEHFYYSFQRSKPIMLTEFAVSHRSGIDMAYRIPLAVDEISRVYGEFPREFPRLKAIVYTDINMTRSNHMTRDNFALLEQPEILSAYSGAVAAR
ncbi:MAG: hypothetical protein FWE68_02845, partial [Defluviitaleaceae bacterium]|nr:hypothetical protein [Defluviitaleaceae bacterium]